MKAPILKRQPGKPTKNDHYPLGTLWPHEVKDGFDVVYKQCSANAQEPDWQPWAYETTRYNYEIWREPAPLHQTLEYCFETSDIPTLSR